MTQHAHAIGPYAELVFYHAIMAPKPDMVLVGELARLLSHKTGALDRAMFTAIYHAPSIPGANGNGYLDVVDLLWRMGADLPPAAVWLAYSDQINSTAPNPRAQEMTRLLVSKGADGLAELQLMVACWPELYPAHADFMESLASK